MAFQMPRSATIADLKDAMPNPIGYLTGVIGNFAAYGPRALAVPPWD
jgi:hypothetical protein